MFVLQGAVSGILALPLFRPASVNEGLPLSCMMPSLWLVWHVLDTCFFEFTLPSVWEGTIGNGVSQDVP